MVGRDRAPGTGPERPAKALPSGRRGLAAPSNRYTRGRMAQLLLRSGTTGVYHNRAIIASFRPKHESLESALVSHENAEEHGPIAPRTETR
jgi:hypothetical protein